MLVDEYINSISTDILDLDISKIYTKANRVFIKTRLKNQLGFFDRLALDSAKIADVGSGLGIHANFFHLKGAQVKLFEPDEELCNSCKLLFPHLSISNNEFNIDDIFDIITLFGVYQFVSKEYIDNIYQHTKILIVDSATPVELDYKCKFTKAYFDPITNYDSNRKRQFIVYINNKI